MQRPFENATALLDFLQADEPERYVFRGQTRSYEGPMLPSGLRDRFTPFNSSTERSKWVGISTFRSVLNKEIEARRQATSPETWEGDDVDDGKTTWDLPEAVYQIGFRDFFNQPHRQHIKDLGNVLRESAVPGITTLMGDRLGYLLSQQYGFTSTALDVTTDPSVALFFAIHQAPFYTLIADSSDLGVVYRWPRQRAMIAQDLLLPLEDSNFQSIVTSFGNFIKDSADLNVVKDTLVRYTSATGGREKREMIIHADGERRSFDALRFPPGTFDRSRMGRQRTALLWSDFKVVKPLERGMDDSDSAALIGDLLKTHQGEFFHFRHAANVVLPGRLNKFVLWPSTRPPTDCPALHSRAEFQHDRFEFEDLYLEMMLRFFSSCSPCDIVVAKLLEPANRQAGYLYGVAGGVVDLGYLLQPSDARLMAERLRMPETYTPIPTLRYIPAEHVESFQAIFADAVGACGSVVVCGNSFENEDLQGISIEAPKLVGGKGGIPMETVECEQCKSVMGLVRKTPRWALYKCFSGRHVMGQINNELERGEYEDAEREMDIYAESLIGVELTDIANRLRRMSPEERGDFFANNDKPSREILKKDYGLDPDKKIVAIWPDHEGVYHDKDGKLLTEAEIKALANDPGTVVIRVREVIKNDK